MQRQEDHHEQLIEKVNSDSPPPRILRHNTQSHKKGYKKQSNKKARKKMSHTTSSIGSHNTEATQRQQDELVIEQFNSDSAQPRRKKRVLPTVHTVPSLASFLELPEDEQIHIRSCFKGKSKERKSDKETCINTKEQEILLQLQKEFHDQRCRTVEQQLANQNKKKNMKVQKLIKLEQWRRYNEFYVARKKEESKMGFKILRVEINKQYYRHKAQLQKSTVPSAVDLAKKEEIRNGTFLKIIRVSPVEHCLHLRSCISPCSKLDQCNETIRALPIKRDEQLSSCLSPMCKPIMSNPVRIAF